PSVALPAGSKQEQWNWLKNKVLTCPHCLSHLYPGKKLVFGSGNLDAEIFFCGEAPGADEEEQGEVFVGRAGQLLTKIIEAMGIKRSDVYIGNIMNWRPETPNHVGNRPPTQEEMEFCLPYLKGQVEIVKPKVIVALGATAVSGLLGFDSQRRMRDCRGNWFEFNGIPLMVTYHPSYLLRNATNTAKRIVWEDMLQVMKFLNMSISERQKNYFL
ncbi:MAG: uracil-DNA glycosylase, partial [bacterium]